MQLFVITPDLKREIVRVLAYAADPAHVYRPDARVAPPGDSPAYTIHWPIGFRIVFSVTEIPCHTGHGPIHRFRHLSVSVDTPDRLPHPVIVEEIAHLFGFTGHLMGGGWVVEYDSSVLAIQVMQEIEADDGKIEVIDTVPKDSDG